MSPPDRPQPADGIAAGRRLVLVGGDKGLSLAEKLADRLRWLAWRSPFHALRIGGRHPLKLVTVADDPFPGSVARGRALLEGTLAFRGERRAIARIDAARPDWSTGFADHFGSFAWLRDLSTVAPRETAAPIAEALMTRWLDAHADHVTDAGWRPDLWGRRILFWVAHAPLILSSTDLVYRSRVLNTLARGARHLERTADRVPAGPARLAAWSGVIAAGLLIPGGEGRRAMGEAGLARAIGVSVSDDGGTVGRSPIGQLDALTILVQLAQVYAARRLEPPAFFVETIALLVPPLLGTVAGDGALGSWQGGGPVAADTVAAAVAASGVRTRPLRQAGDWGYQRLQADRTLVVMDAAPPPVGRLNDGGCASTLAFELSDGPRRIVVNCGGARMASATLPRTLTEALRTTAAHSTLVLGDRNSTAINADGSLGRGVTTVEVARIEDETLSRIEASHDGYARRLGLIHRRTVTLGADGRDVRGDDVLVPSDRVRPRGGPPAFAIRFHLAPTVEVAPTADGQGAVLRLPGNILWQFRCKGAPLAIEESLWLDADGRAHPTSQIVVTGVADGGGTGIGWWFRRTK